MPKKLIKILSLLICFTLVFEQSGFTQVAGQLDISGYFAGLHSALAQEKFRPLHLRYLFYDNLQNNFKLLLDKGDLKNAQTRELENQTKTLLQYFFVGISLPNDSFWVNLRPDSPDNIIDDFLAQTDVGKILLEADLQLKKDTAQATSPSTLEGKKYWDRLYKKAEELFGSENITIPTLTRPWIVPGEIIIRETQDNAYIYKATLKVMLEQDYLANGKWQMANGADYSFKDPRLKALNEYSSQLIRELIIPKLTQEVNSSKRYAPLRQVYYSLILAQWFKARFYGKGGLYSYLIDKKNLTNLTSKDNWSKTTYFKDYQTSFKNGEYNLKEPIQTPFGQSIRNYFSGGIELIPQGTSFPQRPPTAASPMVVSGPYTSIHSAKKLFLGLSPVASATVTNKKDPSNPYDITVALTEEQNPTLTNQPEETKKDILAVAASPVQSVSSSSQAKALPAENKVLDLVETPEEARNVETGDELRAIRRQLGLSQAGFGELVRPGKPYSRSIISQWERGLHPVPAAVLQAAEKAQAAKDGEALKKLLEEWGLNQATLGKLLRPENPYDENTISQWEQGITPIPPKILEAIRNGGVYIQVSGKHRLTLEWQQGHKIAVSIIREEAVSPSYEKSASGWRKFGLWLGSLVPLNVFTYLFIIKIGEGWAKAVRSQWKAFFSGRVNVNEVTERRIWLAGFISNSFWLTTGVPLLAVAWQMSSPYAFLPPFFFGLSTVLRTSKDLKMRISRAYNNLSPEKNRWRLLWLCAKTSSIVILNLVKISIVMLSLVMIWRLMEPRIFVIFNRWMETASQSADPGQVLPRSGTFSGLTLSKSAEGQTEKAASSPISESMSRRQLLKWGMLAGAGIAASNLVYPDWWKSWLHVNPGQVLAPWGTFNELRGYTTDVAGKLKASNFAVTYRRQSKTEKVLIEQGIIPPLNDPGIIGLTILGQNNQVPNNQVMFQHRRPFAIEHYEDLHPLVWAALLAREDKQYNPTAPADHNTAYNLKMLLSALWHTVSNSIHKRRLQVSGASGIDIQRAKIMFSPGGSTRGAKNPLVEKIKQYATASIYSYKDGNSVIAPQTLQQVLVDYINFVNFGASKKYGGINNGFGEALYAWFGTDIAHLNQDLNLDEKLQENLKRKATALMRVLYLVSGIYCPALIGPDASTEVKAQLEAVALSLLKDLHERELISESLYQTTSNLQPRITWNLQDRPVTKIDYPQGKTPRGIRLRMAKILGVEEYALKQFNMSVGTTFDAGLTEKTEEFLSHLYDKEYLRQSGILEALNQNSAGGPVGDIRYVVSLGKATEGRNEIVVAADTWRGQNDLVRKANVEMGSTAKAFTAAEYMMIVEDICNQHRNDNLNDLEKACQQAKEAGDPISQWTLEALLKSKRASATGAVDVKKILTDSWQVEISASRETFVTGGDQQYRPSNYENKHYGEAPTIATAFEESINLPFIRLGQWILQYYFVNRLGYNYAQAINNLQEPARKESEGSVINEQRRQLQLGMDEFVKGLLGASGTKKKSIAKAIAGVRDSALRDFIKRKNKADKRFRDWLNGISKCRSYEKYQGKANLQDLTSKFIDEAIRDFARNSRERAPRDYVESARNSREGARRAYFEMERKAFEFIKQDWRKLGFSQRLVPSLATFAMGVSSGSLEDLMNLFSLIQSNGTRLPVEVV